MKSTATRRPKAIVTVKDTEKWRSDLRRMTKIYKDIDPEQDNALEKFVEARKLFRNFRDNLESWLGNVVLQTRQSEESGVEKNLRMKAWTAVHSLMDLFPTSHNYKTDSFEPSPYRLRQDRDKEIRRYQKAFNEALAVVDDYIKFTGENERLVRFDAEEVVRVQGMHIVLHGRGRKDHAAEIKGIVQKLEKCASDVIRAGFAKAISGLTVHLRFESHSGGLRAGDYHFDTDELNVYPLGFDRDTFVHEVGHRFYARALTNRARAHWVSSIENHTVLLNAKDVASYLKRYHEGRGRYRERKEVLAEVERDNTITDEMRAKYRELADRVPGFTDDLSKIQDFMVKNLEDRERVYIEEISEYGQTNAMEAFAEAFMLRVRYGLPKLGPWTRALFQRTVGSRG